MYRRRCSEGRSCSVGIFISSPALSSTVGVAALWRDAQHGVDTNMAGRSWPSTLQGWRSRELRAGDVGMQIRKIIANVTRPRCAAELTSRSRGFPSFLPPPPALLRDPLGAAQCPPKASIPTVLWGGLGRGIDRAALWGSPCRKSHLLSGAPACARGHWPARPACLRSVPPLHQPKQHPFCSPSPSTILPFGSSILQLL